MAGLHGWTYRSVFGSYIFQEEIATALIVIVKFNHLSRGTWLATSGTVSIGASVTVKRSMNPREAPVTISTMSDLAKVPDEASTSLLRV